MGCEEVIIMDRKFETSMHVQLPHRKETDGVIENQYIDPQEEHHAAARKLDLAVEAINRARNPHLYTPKRDLIRSLAYYGANPDVSLEEIARNSGLPLELLQEDLQSARGAFQWAANVLSGGNNLKDEPKE